MRIIVTAAAAAALLAAAPAAAKEMHCNVDRDIASQIDGKVVKHHGTTYRLKVKDRFKGTPDGVSTRDYNRFVNVKFGEETSPSYDPNVNVRVRPRRGDECLNRVETILTFHVAPLWEGAYCNTKKHLKPGSVGLTPIGEPIHWAVGSARTTTKVNHFAAIYVERDDTYHLSGACVENR